MSSQPLMEQESTWKDQHSNIAEDDKHPEACCLLGSQTASSRASKRLTLMAVLQLSIQILLSILLIANLLALAFSPRNRKTGEEESNFESNSASVVFNFTSKVLHAQYGSDISYMSLDPQYDWLWSSENDKYAGLITLDPPNTDGSIRWGAITM